MPSAVRYFPVIVIGPCVAVGGTLLLMRAVAVAGPAALVFGVLAAAAVVTARMQAGVIAYQLGGSYWQLTRPPTTTSPGSRPTGWPSSDGALAVAGSGIYATAAEEISQRRARNITLGAPTQPARPQHWQ
jgi:hypothetical protein